MHFKIESGARLFQQLSGYQMIENNGNVPLQLDWLLGRYSVSKSAVLLTEWVSESDLVSKTPNLLTERGVRRARCDGPEVAARERERAAKGQR